jgi:hypothetical protein
VGAKMVLSVLRKQVRPKKRNGSNEKCILMADFQSHGRIYEPLAESDGWWSSLEVVQQPVEEAHYLIPPFDSYINSALTVNGS